MSDSEALKVGALIMQKTVEGVLTGLATKSTSSYDLADTLLCKLAKTAVLKGPTQAGHDPEADADKMCFIVLSAVLEKSLRDVKLDDFVKEVTAMTPEFILKKFGAR